MRVADGGVMTARPKEYLVAPSDDLLMYDLVQYSTTTEAEGDETEHEAECFYQSAVAGTVGLNSAICFAYRCCH